MGSDFFAVDEEGDGMGEGVIGHVAVVGISILRTVGGGCGGHLGRIVDLLGRRQLTNGRLACVV